MRATTNRVMAAVDAFVVWMLFGPRQHEADLLAAMVNREPFTAWSDVRASAMIAKIPLVLSRHIAHVYKPERAA